MRNESQEISSPASSITKLGFVRFCPEEPGLSGDLRRIRVIELPSFSLDEPERPRVKMQRLLGRRRAWTANSRDADSTPHAASGDESSAQRTRSATLRGVEPFPVRSRGSSPAIVITTREGTLVAGELISAVRDERPTDVALPRVAVSEGRPTDVDLAPIAASDERPTDLDLAPIAYEAAATPAELAAAEVETEQAVLLLSRLRRLSQPPVTEAERAAMRRLRRLTQPRSSGASSFDALAGGAEIVVGTRESRAKWRTKWRAAVVGAAVAIAAAAIGLAALL